MDARIERLRERLKGGDPDLAADELEAGIQRAENKRHELLNARPAERENARVLACCPGRRSYTASRLIRDSEAISLPPKARVILRDMLGEIMLSPGEDDSLWAEYGI